MRGRAQLELQRVSCVYCLGSLLGSVLCVLAATVPVAVVLRMLSFCGGTRIAAVRDLDTQAKEGNKKRELSSV